MFSWKGECVFDETAVSVSSIILTRVNEPKMLGVCTWRSQLVMVGIACLSILTGLICTESLWACVQGAFIILLDIMAQL